MAMKYTSYGENILYISMEPRK